MWQLADPTLTLATLTLVDIGQGAKTTVTQLWQGDVRLINALERVNWQDTGANFQFELCETCGLVGCQPQGWVSVRKIGNVVGILPAFDIIAQAARDLRDEYLPPAYLENGATWLTKAQYENLHVSFPSYAQLPSLTGWEATKLIQWEACHRVLGEIHTTPSLSSDIVVASSEGSFLEQVPVFVALLDQLLISSQPAAIRPVAPQAATISFYLDVAGIPAWKALVCDDSRYGLYLEPGHAVFIR